MDRYKAYLLPGVAAVVVLAYYGWRWIAGDSVVEPAPAQGAPGGSMAEPQAATPSSPAAPAEGEPPAAERTPKQATPAPAEPEAQRARERARRDELSTDDEP